MRSGSADLFNMRECVSNVISPLQYLLRKQGSFFFVINLVRALCLRDMLAHIFDTFREKEEDNLERVRC